MTTGIAIALLFVTWVGVNATWGLLGPGDTLVSAWLQSVFPLSVWIGLCVLLLFVGMTAARRQRRAGLVTLTLVLGAYFGGVAVSEVIGRQLNVAETWLRPMIGSLFPLLDRSVLLVQAVPMFGVLWARHGFDLTRTLRVGDWNAEVTLWSREGHHTTWNRVLIAWVVLFVLPAALLMQAQVGFAPFRSGMVWPALVPLTGLAFLNGFTEELLFRGLLQPVLALCLGPGKGIWMQAAFFGLHHWGASPGAAAGLPALVLTGLAGFLWGRSVLETKGLGWAVLTHASIDLPFFLVQFVPVE